MALYPVGCTAITPRTYFLWQPEKEASVEITDLGSDQFLVKASKSYRLLKQGEDGRETWQRNLSKLNDYLADTFSNFQVSVDYVNTVTDDVVGGKEEAAEAVQHSQELIQHREELESQLENLEQGLEFGLSEFKKNLQLRHESLSEELDEVDWELEKTVQYLEKKKEQLGEWQSNGVMLSYLFTFSSDPQICRGDELAVVVEGLVDEVFDHHRRKVKQTLRGPNFQLVIEELDHPRVFNRTEHSSLLNPEALHQLEEENPEVAGQLQDLRETSVQQFEAYALKDLSTNDGVFERSKATPGQAVRSILKDLETESVVAQGDPPNDGPMIGTLAGSKKVVGFDPAELPHYYIVGETGSGKTYLKKVLIENIASLGYDVLTITPSDTEGISLNLPNPDQEQGTGLDANQYWIGDDRLLDEPDDIRGLFSGVNAVTLQGLPDVAKQEFVTRVFTEAEQLKDLSNPLFIFLEEAHEFNTGAAADAIQSLVRIGRKFMVHVGIVSQSPMDFNRNHKHVRENTTTVFLPGEYTDYAGKFLDDEDEITDLGTGQAILQARDFPKLVVDIRSTLTQPSKPSTDQINRVDQVFSGKLPEFNESGSATPTQSKGEQEETGLTEDENQVLEAIQSYITREDELPSKNKVIQEGPFGAGKTSRILNQLREKDVVEQGIEERYGNEAQVFQPR